MQVRAFERYIPLNEKIVKIDFLHNSITLFSLFIFTHLFNPNLNHHVLIFIVNRKMIFGVKMILFFSLRNVLCVSTIVTWKTRQYPECWFERYLCLKCNFHEFN